MFLTEISLVVSEEEQQIIEFLTLPILPRIGESLLIDYKTYIVVSVLHSIEIVNIGDYVTVDGIQCAQSKIKYKLTVEAL